MDFNKPHLKVCYDKFRKSKYGKAMRLKYPIGGNPPMPLPPEVVDRVDLDIFERIEVDRIPLFMASQFGVYPTPGEVLVPGRTYIVATYSKSVLSGYVSGLYLHRIDGKTGKWETLVRFSNITN